MNENDDRLNLNGNNWNDNNNGYAFGMALALRHYAMNTRNLYKEVYSIRNLKNAWKKARKGKTQKLDVIEFEKDLVANLSKLHEELKSKTYKPKPLATFILRDPKTRVISKSDFRDRVIHHALIRVVGNIFEKQFIYDSCANQIGKGNLFALERFDKYARKATQNYTRATFCLKADIKHYFDEINHETLMNIISRNIEDANVLWLIRQILSNNACGSGGGRTTPRHATGQPNLSVLCECLSKRIGLFCKAHAQSEILHQIC